MITQADARSFLSQQLGSDYRIVPDKHTDDLLIARKALLRDPQIGRLWINGTRKWCLEAQGNQNVELLKSIAQKMREQFGLEITNAIYYEKEKKLPENFFSRMLHRFIE